MLEQIFFATSAVGTIFNFVRLCSTAIILDYVPILYEIGYLQVGIKVKDCNWFNKFTITSFKLLSTLLGSLQRYPQTTIKVREDIVLGRRGNSKWFIKIQNSYNNRLYFNLRYIRACLYFIFFCNYPEVPNYYSVDCVSVCIFRLF